MRLEWIDEQLKKRKLPRRALAFAIPGMTEAKLSLVMSGTRKLSSTEADNIRRFFGYRLPDDPITTLADKVQASLSALDDDQLQTVVLYLEALTGANSGHQIAS